jgi:hypothetical protein
MTLDKTLKAIPKIEGRPVDSPVVGYAMVSVIHGYRPLAVIGVTKEGDDLTGIVCASQVNEVKNTLYPVGSTSLETFLPGDVRNYRSL